MTNCSHYSLYQHAWHPFYCYCWIGSHKALEHWKLCSKLSSFTYSTSCLLTLSLCMQFSEFYNGSGFGNNGYAFLLVILQSQYTLSSYDGAAHMAEGMYVKRLKCMIIV